jgi:poly-gamma-glutamate capsule biosynthesis protein CapA/YwtB (metallophosphatase superfamily)
VRVSRLTFGFVLMCTGLLIAGVAWAGAVVLSPSSRHPRVSIQVPRQHSRRPSARRLERHGPVVLAFAGDVHFEGALGARLAADPETALAPVEPLFAGADLVIVNLETAIGVSGKPQDKQYVFRAPPSAFRALRAARVDVVTMANNHGMDYGAPALRESLDAAQEESIVVVGAGLNAHGAYSPFVVERNGERIAIFGATQVLDQELERSWTATDAKLGLASAKHVALRRLLHAIRTARRRVDLVVVDLHWGREMVACPTSAQRGLMRSLVAAGADVIVGSHAHVLLGRGYFGRAFVHYGLGNFAFYARKYPATRTGVLLLTVRGRDVTADVWRPALISAGIPAAMRGAARVAAMHEADQLRKCTDLAAAPTPRRHIALP